MDLFPTLQNYFSLEIVTIEIDTLDQLVHKLLTCLNDIKQLESFLHLCSNILLLTSSANVSLAQTGYHLKKSGPCGGHGKTWSHSLFSSSLCMCAVVMLQDVTVGVTTILADKMRVTSWCRSALYNERHKVFSFSFHFRMQ